MRTNTHRKRRKHRPAVIARMAMMTVVFDLLWCVPCVRYDLARASPVVVLWLVYDASKLFLRCVCEPSLLRERCPYCANVLLRLFYTLGFLSGLLLSGR